MKNRIFLSPPHMGGNELKYINEAFESNYIAPVGENLNKFEEAIKSFSGAKYALALSSGTSAIHLALRCLGIKEGDEVFASTFTFIGSVVPILYERATPFFIDSELKSWNLDANLLYEELKERHKNNQSLPKALIVTHLYGQCADILTIKSICNEFGVILIEDAAESLGATFENRQSGTFGKAGIYSFNGNKIITTSGGGVLVSDDESLIKEARFLSTQARENYLHYEHNTYGYNYRMSNIVAAIGRGQMEVLSQRIEKKREIFNLYKNFLGEEVEFMPELANSKGNRWLSAVLFKEPKFVNKVIEALESENIESRPLWKPMHTQPVFKDTKSRLNGVSEDLFSRGICLPSGTNMGENEVKFVSEIIIKTLARD